VGLILIVDDDDDMREALAILLARRGYRAAEAANGQLALARLAGGLVPSLILLDLMMPAMSGWDFIKALREDEALSRIPVVVLTGYLKMLGSGPLPGTIEVLAKPLDIPRLFEILEHHSPGQGPA
jgi:CheY-like chemotaxis protein